MQYHRDRLPSTLAVEQVMGQLGSANLDPRAEPVATIMQLWALCLVRDRDYEIQSRQTSPAETTGPL